jgi:hypothetical protein
MQMFFDFFYKKTKARITDPRQRVVSPFEEPISLRREGRGMFFNVEHPPTPLKGGKNKGTDYISALKVSPWFISPVR